MHSGIPATGGRVSTWGDGAAQQRTSASSQNGAATLAWIDLRASTALMPVRCLRVPSARRLVLEALLAADGPMSAEQIAEGIGGRVASSDIASVYRDLQAFEDVGLVQ